MQEIYVAALLAYIEILEIHIDTKSGNEPLHRKTWEFYEWLFEIAHWLGERHVDLGGHVREDTGNCDAQASRVVEILLDLKAKLEWMEWLSKWTENLVSGQIDNLECMIGAAMWFTKRIEWKGNPPIMQEETKQETIKEPALQKDTVVEVEWIIEL